MPEEFGFTFRGERVSPDKFRPEYISEFQHVLQTYAPNATTFLEWGSGLTTQMIAAHAGRIPGAELFLTIDAKPDYQRAIFAERERPAFLREVALDLTGPQSMVPELPYSTYPLGLNRKFDFIFIDGRRRVECAFVAMLLCHERTIVAMHDYRRIRYQPIRALFGIIEDGPEFRVMRPRDSVASAIAPALSDVQSSMTT